MLFFLMYIRAIQIFLCLLLFKTKLHMLAVNRHTVMGVFACL